MFYVGIDWADQKHDVCVVDEKGERVVNFTIPHTAQGLSKLHHRLSMITPNRDDLLLALETDKGLVVSFLLDLGYTVYPINPKVVSHYRDRYRTSGPKSDPLDALVLANILRTDRHRFRPLLPDSTLARELKILTRDHRHLPQGSLTDSQVSNRPLQPIDRLLEGLLPQGFRTLLKKRI